MIPWPKRCACGREHSRAEWDELPLVGVTDEHPDDAALVTEMRNCPCGSTLGVLVTDLAKTAARAEVAA